MEQQLYHGNKIVIYLKGHQACFTIPGTQVSKISYDIPTITILQGILHAFAWRIEKKTNDYADYVIDKLYVCSPIKTTNVLYNFVNTKVKDTHLESGMDCVSVRTQINHTMLMEPEYIVEAHMIGTTPEIANKQYDIFRHRVKNMCPDHQPKFGTKCDITHYKWLDPDKPIQYDMPPELKGERKVFNYLIGKGYNPLRNKYSDQIAYSVLPSITIKDGIVDFTNIKQF
jgi:CRISPR-associated Cas5-like protein